MSEIGVDWAAALAEVEAKIAKLTIKLGRQP
jgi:hypothetical protein